MPVQEVTSLNCKVIGLTRPGLEPATFRFEPVRFGFPDLPAWQMDALLIQPPCLVSLVLPGLNSNPQPLAEEAS